MFGSDVEAGIGVRRSTFLLKDMLCAFAAPLRFRDVVTVKLGRHSVSGKAAAWAQKRVLIAACDLNAVLPNLDHLPAGNGIADANGLVADDGQRMRRIPEDADQRLTGRGGHRIRPRTEDKRIAQPLGGTCRRRGRTQRPTGGAEDQDGGPSPSTDPNTPVGSGLRALGSGQKLFSHREDRELPRALSPEPRAEIGCGMYSRL